jgi:prephenate dehydrogenase
MTSPSSAPSPLGTAPSPLGTAPSPGGTGQRRAAVIGTGLIGGSIGLALRRQGWWVSGSDRDPLSAERALQLGAIDCIDMDYRADVTFVAVPAGAVAEVARGVLFQVGEGQVVTDVAGVKAPIVKAVRHAQFVGGHPMAGSEQEGVDGADPDLFMGATWVLTPDQGTSAQAYTQVQALVRSLGANPVALAPRRHDELVALVSHTPHLTAATLMNLAADASAADPSLLRLAAGGFRDMTRIASGHPGIWPDVVAENKEAILNSLDRLSTALDKVRAVVAADDRDGLLALLERAREGRVNLPVGAPSLEEATEVRVPVPDRPGVIAEVSTLLGSLGVNIFDLEIAHSSEGDRGVMVLVVDASTEGVVREALTERGYRVSLRRMHP